MIAGLGPDQTQNLQKWVRRGAIVGGATVAAGVGLRLISRAQTRGLESRPDPTTDYPDAVERLDQLRALDDDTVNPVCRSRGLLHGRKTEQAVILIHGLTNCPQQFAPLGTTLFERGVNVLLPRMPRHGLADRLTTELGKLRAEELRAFGDQVVDIGAGLGDRVTVVGLSAGGLVAAWAAQYRSELDKAVLIAPSSGFGSAGGYLQLFFMNVARALPDIATQRFIKTDTAMPYAYVGWSSRSLGEVLRFGLATFRAAVGTKPATQHLVMVTNANDTAVNNQLARHLVALWQTRGLRRIESYEFDRELGLEHDLIDPNNPRQQIDRVYPLLLDLILGR
jgi:pimeloyl-ACP methyl ester carboxylesterase